MTTQAENYLVDIGDEAFKAGIKMGLGSGHMKHTGKVLTRGWVGSYLHDLQYKRMTMCGSRKDPYPPQGRSLEIPSGGGRGGGVLAGSRKPNFLKESMKLNRKFQWGGRVQTKNPVLNDRSCSVPVDKND